MKRIAAILASIGLIAVWSCEGGGLSDKLAPRIENLQIQPQDLITSGTQVVVQASVTDESSGVKEVLVRVSYPDGKEQIVSMTAQAVNRFSATFNAQWDDRVLPQDYESWVIRFAVIAVDKAGNKAESVEKKVRAAIGPPDLPLDF